MKQHLSQDFASGSDITPCNKIVNHYRDHSFVIVILAYFTIFKAKPHGKRRLNIKIHVPLFLHWISLNKMASVLYFRTLLCHFNAKARVTFREQMHQQHDHSRPQRFLVQIRAQFRLY